MIIIDTLNVGIYNGKIILNGRTIKSINILGDQTALRSISISPKHRQTFLNGNLMVSDELGIVYVPLDEANVENEYIMLDENGSLSKMPTFSYEEYLKRKEKIRQERYEAVKNASGK